MSDRTHQLALDELVATCREHPVLGPLAERLDAAGTPMYVVGGPVRDALCGLDPSDLDVATAATPAEVADLAADLGTVNLVGAAFGVVKVHHADAGEVDVATFRADTYETGSRNPEVVLVDDIVADLSRRDFTINAMAVKVARDGEAVLVDPFGGVADLAAARLTTPADPAESFADDALRIHRAWRFAATRQLVLDDSVIAAARAAAPALVEVSTERKRVELDKVLSHPGASSLDDALELMSTLGVAGDVLPGFDLGVFVGRPFSRTTTYMARLALLASAVPEPERREVLRAMSFPNDAIAEVVSVLALRESATGPATGRRLAIRRASDTAVDAACEIATLDAAAVFLEDAAARDLWRRPRPVDGHDALTCGLPPSRALGETLARIDEAMVGDELARASDDVRRDVALAMLHQAVAAA